MTDFNLESYITYINFKNKHPEIFLSGKDKQVQEFMDIFIGYNKLINSSKTDGLNKLITQIKKDFKSNEVSPDKLTVSKWSEDFFKFCNPKKDNEVYVFPRNDGRDKLIFNRKFYVNCIKLENIKPNSVVVVNRNNHMMLAGEVETEDNMIGKYLDFKIIMIFNKKLNKWVISPYKVVSKPNNDVRCDSFSLSATTDLVDRQFNVWNQGLDRNKEKLGILNIKYFNEHFKSLPNLFGDTRSKFLIDRAEGIISEYKSAHPSKQPSSKTTKPTKSTKTTKKKSAKKPSKKTLKKSAKKSSKKKIIK